MIDGRIRNVQFGNILNYAGSYLFVFNQFLGLVELILSYNPKITPLGWSKILIAIAASTDLKYLYIDYNNLDDSCGYLIVAAICSNKSIEILDLEHTGLTDKTALVNFLF